MYLVAAAVARMDWSQAIFAGLLLLATITTSDRRLAYAAWANFAATMALAHNPVAVGVADILTASALLCMGRRGQCIAALYAVMIPIYPIMVTAGFQAATIYTIVDILAFAQVAIVGGWGFGIYRGLRPYRSRWDFDNHAMGDGYKAAHNMGIHQEKGAR
ncbi:MAG: hypothetical protein U5N55_04940 [Cypionkella sp.]|nr:hypothetical protein [Cypionkella sp.]